MEYPKRSVNGDAGEYFVAYTITKKLGWPWASAERVQRYAHLSTEHLAQWVNRRIGLRVGEGTDVFTTEKKKATEVVA